MAGQASQDQAAAILLGMVLAPLVAGPRLAAAQILVRVPRAALVRLALVLALRLDLLVPVPNRDQQGEPIRPQTDREPRKVVP